MSSPGHRVGRATTTTVPAIRPVTASATEPGIPSLPPPATASTTTRTASATMTRNRDSLRHVAFTGGANIGLHYVTAVRRRSLTQCNLIYPPTFCRAEK